MVSRSRRGVDGEHGTSPASQLARCSSRRCKLGASSVSGLHIAVCAMLFAGLGGIQSANAMSGNKTLRVSNSLHLLERFCFRDGVAELTIEAERLKLDGSPGFSWRRSEAETVDLDVMICPKGKFEELHRGTLRWPRAQQVCEVDFSSGCDIFPLYEGFGAQTFRKDGLQETHYFLIRNCISPSGRENDSRLGQYSVSVEFSYSNADGSQLSCEYSVFPQLYLSFSAIWMITSAMWIGLWVWRYQQSVAVQRIVSVVPVIQIARAFVAYLLWKETQLTGVRSNVLVILGYFCNALFTSSLFTALLTLSKGFMILHWDTSMVDRRTLSICMCWMVVSSFAYDLLGGFFVFMLVLVVLIILRLIFMSIAQNHELLCSQYAHLLDLGSAVPDQELRTTKELISVYSRFRSVMSMFIFASIMLELVQTFVLTYRQAHLYPALDEAIDWFLIASTGWLFRCRRVPDGSPSPEADSEHGADDARNETDGDRRRESADGRQGRKSETVMVILPGSSGVWASARADQDEATGSGALTYDQLLERVAIGVPASAACARHSPHARARSRSADEGQDATPESGGSGGSSAHRILALLPFHGGSSRAGPASVEGGSERIGRSDDGYGQASATVGMVTSSVVGPPQGDIALVALPGSALADADAEIGWVSQRDGSGLSDQRVGDEMLPAPSVGTVMDTVVQPVHGVQGEGARHDCSGNDLVFVRVDGEGQDVAQGASGWECRVCVTGPTGASASVKAYIIK